MTAVAAALAPVRELQPALLEQHAVPGAVIGVLASGEVEVLASGVASTATGAPVSAGTLFQLGSTTKPWTATAVLRLVEHRLVDLDAPVPTYLPELALADVDAWRITVRQLLTHTSGICGDHLPPGADDWDDGALTRFVASLATTPALHPPGAMWSYCNAGWVVAGALVERVLGERFDTALESLLVRPLGLEGTLLLPDLGTPPVAAGHLVHPATGDVSVVTGPPGAAVLMPAGSTAAATAADVLRFAELHLSDGVTAAGQRLLEAATVRSMHAEQVPLVGVGARTGMGLGWVLGATRGGRRVLAHNGGTLGFASAVELLPDDGVAVVVLTNCASGDAVADAAVRAVLDALLDDAPADAAPPPGAERAVGAADLTGRYAHAASSITVRADGGQLLADLALSHPALDPRSGTGTVPLQRVGGSSFVAPGLGPVRFVAGADGGRPGFAFVAGRLFRRCPE